MDAGLAFEPSPSYSERVLVVAAPTASASRVQELQLSRCESWCSTWWSLTAYSQPGSALDVLICNDPPADIAYPFLSKHLHPALTDSAAWPQGGSFADRQLAAVWSHGWPLRCLSYRAWYNGVPPFGYDYEGALAVPGLRPRFGEIGLWVVLPWRPHWAGFLANSAIFAAGWFGLLCLPSLIIGLSRRARRRRGGLCTACGYNRAGTPEGSPCPECGGESLRAS